PHCALDLEDWKLDGTVVDDHPPRAGADQLQPSATVRHQVPAEVARQRLGVELDVSLPRLAGCLQLVELPSQEAKECGAIDCFWRDRTESRLVQQAVVEIRATHAARTVHTLLAALGRTR